jgi:hypothetical protein
LPILGFGMGGIRTGPFLAKGGPNIAGLYPSKEPFGSTRKDHRVRGTLAPRRCKQPSHFAWSVKVVPLLSTGPCFSQAPLILIRGFNLSIREFRSLVSGPVSRTPPI